MTDNRKLLAAILFLLPGFAAAAQFTCSIENVLRLQENGTFGTHGRAALYQNRKFYLDPDTGKVTGTTALHARLTNFNANATPVVMRGKSYKAITLFRDRDQYALIQIDANSGGETRPYFYHTALDMMLTGTCTED